MIETQGKPQDFKGSDGSTSPTVLDDGVFSFCSGGVPQQGSFARIPGKLLRNSGVTTGGVISIYQMGTLVVIQKYIGVEILTTNELIPVQENFITDNEGNLVYDKEGIAITQ